MSVAPGAEVLGTSRSGWGCAAYNLSSAPQPPGPALRTARPSGWRWIPHVSHPLPLTHIVSNSEFLSGSCKAIQLLPRDSWLSPVPLGYAPVHKVREQPSVPKGSLEHSRRQNALCTCAHGVSVSVPSWVSQSQAHFRAAAEVGSQSRNAGPAGAGRAAFKAPPPPRQRLHLPPRFVQRRSAAAARPDPPARKPAPAAAGTPLRHGPGACIPTPGRPRGAGCGGPPAPLALRPPRRSSPALPQALSGSWSPSPSREGPVSEGSSYSQGSFGWACANAECRMHRSAVRKARPPGAEVQELVGQHPRRPPPTQEKQGAVGTLHPITGGTVSSLYPRNGEQGPRETPRLLGEVFFLGGKSHPTFPSTREGLPQPAPHTGEGREGWGAAV